jgi:hypothetical protein
VSDTTSARTFRFGPLDRSGLILGVTGRQAAALGTAAVLAGWLLDRHAPAPFVLTPLLVAAVVAFARVGGDAAVDLLPVWAGFAGRAVLRRNRWLAPIPSRRAGQSPPVVPALPSFMAGLVLVDAGPVPWAPARLASVGAVVDRRAGTVCATVPVRTGGFCLLDRSEQERLISGWGDALGGFCQERSAVASVRWTESMAPVGLDGCRRFLADYGRGMTDALEDYRQLLDDVEATSSGHQALVTVTVAERRVRRSGGQRGVAATDALLEEVRLLTARLRAAGLDADVPLSPAELADTIRRRVDPYVTPVPGTSPSVASAAGIVSMSRAAPLATDMAWSHARVDSSAHRSFWISEWPRLDMPPNWIEPLLMQPGAVRTISVLYEPVPPGRSRRQVDREATKLASDEEQRARSGFRIGARHRRQQGALAEREAELVAGYAELCFAGFLTVSSPDPNDLDYACGEYLQAAAQSGLELRPLHGRHDLGLLCTLPVGRGLAERRLT